MGICINFKHRVKIDKNVEYILQANSVSEDV